jgi:hypothetical protein
MGGPRVRPKSFPWRFAVEGFDFHILLPEGVKLCDAAQLIDLAGKLAFATCFYGHSFRLECLCRATIKGPRHPVRECAGIGIVREAKGIRVDAPCALVAA